MLILHVLQGPDRGRKFELPETEPQLIGRSTEALPISDTTVSRRHAELTPDHGKWFLRDLDSANGTFINGNRITERTQLKPGDQIRCGSTLFTFARKPRDPKSSMVELVDAEEFDLTVEGLVENAPSSDAGEGHDLNEDSMVLASPDPAKAARDHLRVIYELTALTGSIIDREPLLERVMDLIFSEFNPDRGFILLQDSAESRPEPMVVRYKVRPKNLDEGRIPVSRTIVQHVLRRNQGILSTNAMNDSRFRSGDSVKDYGIRSAICVPIRTGNRTFGVIHIDSSLANFTFTDSQLELLNAIGQHTGLALRSAEQVSSQMQTERLAAMGQTVASLSHSIKNILQGLRGGADAVELALKRGDLQLANDGWPILARNLDRIYAMTLNMLAYSKQRNLEIDLTSLHALIEEIVELLQVATKKKGAGVILDLAEDMPPLPLDVGAMHQALMNVLTNAIDAVPERKGMISIRTEFDARENCARITISDNGPGVPREWRERIFDAFSTSKGQRGTGLGLAVTRKIMQEHGGTIRLLDDHDGASFRIELPSDRGQIDPGDTRLPKPAEHDELALLFDDEDQPEEG